METEDVWLISLGDEGTEAVLGEFALAFELPLERARAITERLPRVVQRGASPDEASRLAERLRAVGASVEVRPSAPAIELSPGSRPSRASQPVPAAPPVSLYPRPSSERSRSIRPSFRPRADAHADAPSSSRRALGVLAIVLGVGLGVVTHLSPIFALGAVGIGLVLIVKR